MAIEELTLRATLRDELSRPLRRVREHIRETARETDRLSNRARGGARELHGLGLSAHGLGRALKVGVVGGAALAGGALAGIGAAAAVGLGKTIKLASDAGETASKFATVFEAQEAEMQAWAKTMHAQTGITTKDLKDAASTFGVFGQAAGIPGPALAGFSKDLAGAGLDLASFYNVDPQDAFLALRSGLAGESEPLRQFGIFLSDAELNAHALEKGLGKTTQQMTEGEKVALRQSYIMENLGKAEGDLARTSGSLANTWRSLKGRMTEAATIIGQALEPHVTKLADSMDTKLAAGMERVQRAADAFPAQLQNFRNHLAEARDELTGTGSAGDRAAAALGVFGLGMPGLAGLVDTVLKVLTDVGTVVKDLIIPAIADASSVLPGFTSPLTVARNVLGFVADNAKTLKPLLTGLILGFLALKAATAAHNAVMIAGNAITFIRTAMTGGLAAAQAGATLATGGLAVGTGILNAVMSANPIVLIVAGLMLLVGALVLAWKKSEGFRDALKAVWSAIKNTAISALQGVIDFFLGWVETLVGGAAKAFGWVPGIGPKLRTAAEEVAKFRDNVNASLEGIKDRKITVGVTLGDVRGRVEEAGGVDKNDTRSSKAGPGNLAMTMAQHAAYAAGGSSRPVITNALIGGGGFGRGSGDHQDGRALDLKGSNLIGYARRVRADGGYAAFHGTGAGRHLHAAMGDTGRARAGARRPMDGGASVPVIIQGPLIHVDNISSDVDLDAAAERALIRLERMARERS